MERPRRKKKGKEESWKMLRQDERGTKRNVRLICPICSIESLFHSLPLFFGLVSLFIRYLLERGQSDGYTFRRTKECRNEVFARRKRKISLNIARQHSAIIKEEMLTLSQKKRSFIELWQRKRNLSST